MHEVLLVLSGTILGTVFIGAGVFLGAWLVQRTYSELTHPHPLLLKVVEQENIDTSKPDGYVWDEYDQYLKPPHNLVQSNS